MSEDGRAVDQFCDLVEHWVVLSVAVFITSCATRNFTILQLLKQPVRFAGRIESGVAAVALPKWFPVQDSVLEVAGGALYTKLRDLPFTPRTEAADAQNVRVSFDLRGMALPGNPATFTLTYFPWFRFLSEPVNFDAVGRVADYVADCLRFLLVRNGIAASVESHAEGEGRLIRAAGGLGIEVIGMQTLRSIAVCQGSMRSLFALDSQRLEIDRRMFPAAFDAGQALLTTPDRLINVDAAIEGDRLTLAATGGSTHVQA